MRKRLVLHIGMGKTGTTALQHFFWSNRQALARHGIVYPDYGSVAEAHHLLSPHVPPFLRDVWHFTAVEEWAPRLQKAAQEQVLLSSELMAWTAPARVAAFCNTLRDSFDVTVVVYVRRQDNMIMADFNQLVKAGSQKHELPRVLERQIRRFDYQKLLQPWSDALGSGNVVVRPYERQQFHGGDIRPDFIRHAFDLEISEDFRLSHEDANPRLSPSALEYKLNLNRIMGDPVKSALFNDVLMAWSAREDGSSQRAFSTHSLLPTSTRKYVLECCDESNAAVARLYLHRQDGRLFREAPPDGPEYSAESVPPRSRGIAITRYIRESEPGLIDLLCESVESVLSSGRRVHREAVQFFMPCLLDLSRDGE